MKNLIIASLLFASASAFGNSFGDTQLHSAIRQGNVHKVSTILANHPNPRSLCKKNKQGYTPYALNSILHEVRGDDIWHAIYRPISKALENAGIGYDCR